MVPLNQIMAAGNVYVSNNHIVAIGDLLSYLIVQVEPGDTFCHNKLEYIK
jgi:hypothetical protein